MKAEKTIWNRLLAALGGMIFFFCHSAASACCCIGDQTDRVLSHECCQEMSEPVYANAALSKEYQIQSCVCGHSQAETAQRNRPAFAVDDTAEIGERLAFRCEFQIDYGRRKLKLAHASNHNLKPSKIYLLNRSLLN